MKIHYNQNLKSFSQLLRKQSTLAEVLLWKEIKGKKLRGYSFMRQKPILDFVVDFYCDPLRLVIEIDGVSHDAKIGEDARRQAEIENLGVTFLRFTEKEVRGNMDSVLREIERWMEKRTTP